MMSSKIKSANNDGAGDSNSGQLLQEIEAISKALHLQKASPKLLLSPSDVRSKSAGKIRPYLNQRVLRRDLLRTGIKLSSTWNWKKPLKALTHIRQRKFNCLFHFHVHSIEGLPSSFNGYSLCVYWKRKDQKLQTHPSKIFLGMAEFDETLIHRCSVYGSRSGPDLSAKYDPKLFLIHVSLIGAPGLDLGKHWVDLTRILPLGLEELEGQRSTGKWTTSFKLKGKAEGSTLNVSFGFSVIRDDVVNLNVPKILNLVQNGPTIAEKDEDFTRNTSSRMLRRVQSVSSSLNYETVLPSPSAAGTIGHEISLNPRLELSKSIKFLYQKLDEGGFQSSAKSDLEFVEQFKLNSDVESESAEEVVQDENESSEFTVIDCGMEVTKTGEPILDEGTLHSSDGSTAEGFYLDENDRKVLDQTLNHISHNHTSGNYINEFVVDDYKCEENSICNKKPTMEELDSDYNQKWISQSPGMDPPSSLSELLKQEDEVDAKAKYKASKMVKKSLSLDDVTESVANDFLNMLGLEPGSFRFSDSDPESPREILLRQFEEEDLVSGNSIFYNHSKEEWQDIVSVDTMESSSKNHDEESDSSTIIHAAVEELKRDSHLINRREAKIVEDMETEALMREWGFDEKDFQYSPRNGSGGFGSPIELPQEELLKASPLATVSGALV